MLNRDAKGGEARQEGLEKLGHVAHRCSEGEVAVEVLSLEERLRGCAADSAGGSGEEEAQLAADGRGVTWGQVVGCTGDEEGVQHLLDAVGSAADVDGVLGANPRDVNLVAKADVVVGHRLVLLRLDEAWSDEVVAQDEGVLG